jgi:hypothetical protein
VQTTIDLRRAIDLLVKRRDVDAARIGYWGVSHDSAHGVKAWQAAASQPKQVKTYPTDHFLSAAATAEGLDWLIERLRTH